VAAAAFSPAAISRLRCAEKSDIRVGTNVGTLALSRSCPFMMQTPKDMPYWMRSIGRHLRSHCRLERPLPFAVRLNLLHLLRIEGDFVLLRTHPDLF
jgi:hypothetical protein